MAPPIAKKKYPQGKKEFDNLKAKLNIWRTYNGEKVFTDDEITDVYRSRNYVPETPVPGPPVPPPPIAVPYPPPDGRPKNATETNFLASTISSIMDGTFPKANWTGVGILGAGSFGIVGHWAYDTRQPNLPRDTDVAVKEAVNPEHDLKAEGAMMKVLGRLSEHVVKLVKDPVVEPVAPPGQDSSWNHKTKRLVMEYCSGSSVVSSSHCPSYSLPFHLDRFCLPMKSANFSEVWRS